MPYPSQVHVNTALTNISVQMSSEQVFVSQDVFPAVPVKKQSDIYYLVDSNLDAIRPTDDSRAPGAAAQEVDWSNGNDTYRCKDHSLMGVIPDEERENADAALQPDIDKTEFLKGVIMLNKEVDLVTSLASSLATEGTNLKTVSNAWSNYTTGDPVADVSVGQQLFSEKSKGCVPNFMVIPHAVYLALKDHPDILDRVKYTGTSDRPAVVSATSLAQVFGVDRVFIPRCFKNSSAKGTASATPVWTGNDVILGYRPDQPGLKKNTLGYTFEWTGASGSIAANMVEAWREQTRKSDAIRVSYYYDQRIINSMLGLRFKSTLG